MSRRRLLNVTRRGLSAAVPVGVALAGLGLSSSPAAAACALPSAVMWTGSASTLWGAGANWTGGVYPNSASTNVCITGGTTTVALDVDATVDNLQNSSTHTLSMDPGTQLSVAGSKVINSGNFDITAGNGKNTVLSIDDDVTLSGGATLGLPGANVTLGSTSGGGAAYIDGAGHTFTNYDLVVQGAGVIGDDGMNFINGPVGVLYANTPGGLLDVGAGGGSFTNRFIVKVFAGSTLRVTADSKGLDQIGGETVVNGQLIAPHGFINAKTSNGVFNGQGVIAGTGTIVGNVVNDGYIGASGGIPDGVLTITGSLVQGPDSHTAVEYYGPTSFNQLDIGGAVTLDGALDVAAIPIGTTDRVMNFGSSTGDFTSVVYQFHTCTAAGTDQWLCGKGFYLQEAFVGGTGLDLIAHGVPEPATWTTMLIGLGALGAALRGRRTKEARRLPIPCGARVS